MQFSILAVAAFAAAAIAMPTNGQDLQQQCGNNQQLSCCDSVQNQLINGIPVAVGVNCVTINVLSVVPVTQQCSTQVACCQSGSQTGLVNVGNVCPVLL